MEVDQHTSFPPTDTSNSTWLSPVILDCGSTTWKYGYAGEVKPRGAFDAILGRTSSKVQPVGGGAPPSEPGKKATGIIGGNPLLGNYSSTKGTDADQYRGVLQLKNPIQHGIVWNWDDLESLIHYTYYNSKTLNIPCENNGVLITEHPYNPLANSEKYTQIMFETFNVPKFAMIKTGIAGLVGSSPSLSGVVVSLGGGVTSITPILHGHEISRGVIRKDFGGDDVTQALLERIRAYDAFSPALSLGFPTRSSHLQIVRDMKEKFCRIWPRPIPGIVWHYSSDAKDKVSLCSTLMQGGRFTPAPKEPNSDPEWTQLVAGSSGPVPEAYVLPDGNQIKLATFQVFVEAPEMIFQPWRTGRETEGIHKLIVNSLNKCPLDARKVLQKNIVVIGGNSMMPGLDTRLISELEQLKSGATVSAVRKLVSKQHTGGGSVAIPMEQVKERQSYLEGLPEELIQHVLNYCPSLRVKFPSERVNAVWRGASILASRAVFDKTWVMKNDYDEYGPSRIKTCFSGCV